MNTKSMRGGYSCERCRRNYDLRFDRRSDIDVILDGHLCSVAFLRSLSGAVPRS